MSTFRSYIFWGNNLHTNGYYHLHASNTLDRDSRKYSYCVSTFMSYIFLGNDLHNNGHYHLHASNTLDRYSTKLDSEVNDQRRISMLIISRTQNHGGRLIYGLIGAFIQKNYAQCGTHQ